MAGHVMKVRRIANRGRRRRNMTPRQIKYFGTARQKAALRNRRRNHYGGRRMNRRRRRNQEFGGLLSSAEHAASQAIKSVERAAEDAISEVTGRLHNRRRNRGRRRNVGEILTIVPAANPGRRRRSNMTRTRNRRRNRRHNYSHRRRNRARAYNYPRRTNRRRRHNVRRRRYNRRHNPRVVVRYRNRRHNYRRARNRRRNPSFMTGNLGAIVGVLGGATVTKLITGFLPSTLTTGWAGYFTTGITAVVTGQVVGKVSKNKQFGNWMMIGGLLIVALEVVGQFFPQLNLPFGLSSGTSGMGLISSSNFYVPQVNMPGSMASFVTPAGVTAAIPVVPAASTSLHGLGGPQFNPGLRTMRRIGRMR